MVVVRQGSGSFLWFCDISEVPSLAGREWDMYLSFLSKEEVDNVLKYRFDDDRRRALVSVMLQKCLVRTFIGAENDTGFVIKRTPEVRIHHLHKRTIYLLHPLSSII